LETCSCASLLPRRGSGPWPRMDELKGMQVCPPIVPVFEVIWLGLRGPLHVGPSKKRLISDRITSNYRQLEKD
jgi:hypothetical protein